MSTTDVCAGCSSTFTAETPAFAKAAEEGCHDQICNSCAFACKDWDCTGMFIVKDVEYIPLVDGSEPKKPVA